MQLQVHDQCITPILTSGAETWTVVANQKDHGKTE